LKELKDSLLELRLNLYNNILGDEGVSDVTDGIAYLQKLDILSLNVEKNRF
jgi:hypothetical protein